MVIAQEVRLRYYVCIITSYLTRPRLYEHCVALDAELDRFQQSKDFASLDGELFIEYAVTVLKAAHRLVCDVKVRSYTCY